MMKEELIEKFSEGIILNELDETQIWIIDTARTTGKKVHLLGFNSKMKPLPLFASWKDKGLKDSVKKLVINRFENFDYHIYLDGERII